MAYSEPSQTSKMEFFWENSSRVSAVSFFRKVLYPRWLSGFWALLLITLRYYLPELLTIDILSFV